MGWSALSYESIICILSFEAIDALRIWLCLLLTAIGTSATLRRPIDCIDGGFLITVLSFLVMTRDLFGSKSLFSAT